MLVNHKKNSLLKDILNNDKEYERQEFHSEFLKTLTPRRKAQTEILWNKHPLFRDWFMGKRVNHGSADNPDWQVISTDILIHHFKLVLASHCKSVIEAIWDNNLILQNAINNSANTAARSDAVTVLAIVIKTNIKGFIKKYLQTVNNREIIQLILEDTKARYNRKLSEYTYKQMSMLEERLQELDNNNGTVAHSVSSTNQNIPLLPKKRNDSPTIITAAPESVIVEDKTDNAVPKPKKKRKIYSAVAIPNLTISRSDSLIEVPVAIPVDFASPGIIQAANNPAELGIPGPVFNSYPDIIVANAVRQTDVLQHLLEEFKLVLSSGVKDNIYQMLNENPLLHDLLASKMVNFGSETRLHLKTIPFIDLHYIYMLALKHCCTDILELMWLGSPLLLKWFSGETISFSARYPDLRIISLDNLIEAFQDALTAKNSRLLYSLLMCNATFKTWLSGSPVKPDISPAREITIYESIAIFKQTLSSGLNDFIQIVWNYNLELRKSCLNREINFGTQLAPDRRKLPFDDLMDIFIAVLKSGHCSIIKDIWNANEEIRSWCYCKPRNSTSPVMSDWKFIPFDTLTFIFHTALFGAMDFIYKAIWEKNSYLCQWYSGKLPGNVISLQDSITIFEIAVHCKVIPFIEFLWDNNPNLPTWYGSLPMNTGAPNPGIISVSDLLTMHSAIKLLGIERIAQVILPGKPQPVESRVKQKTTATGLPQSTYQSLLSITFFGNPEFAGRDDPQSSTGLISRRPF